MSEVLKETTTKHVEEILRKAAEANR